jgi:hypothetical protein
MSNVERDPFRKQEDHDKQPPEGEKPHTERYPYLRCEWVNIPSIDIDIVELFAQRLRIGKHFIGLLADSEIDFEREIPNPDDSDHALFVWRMYTLAFGKYSWDSLCHLLLPYPIYRACVEADIHTIPQLTASMGHDFSEIAQLDTANRECLRKVVTRWKALPDFRKNEY